MLTAELRRLCVSALHSCGQQSQLQRAQRDETSNRGLQSYSLLVRPNLAQERYMLQLEMSVECSLSQMQFVSFF